MAVRTIEKAVCHKPTRMENPVFGGATVVFRAELTLKRVAAAQLSQIQQLSIQLAVGATLHVPPVVLVKVVQFVIHKDRASHITWSLQSKGTQTDPTPTNTATETDPVLPTKVPQTSETRVISHDAH